MATEFAEHGVRFVFVYTREAHPGENYPHHTSFDQKLAHARAMVTRWQIKRPMLVDDLDGPVHRAYGCLPNMTYIVKPNGAILYRASWTDPRTIRLALEQLQYEGEQRRARNRLTPYYLEWEPQRANNREPFMEGLLNTAGPRAVKEFIIAMAHRGGKKMVKPLQDWWASKQREEPK